MTRPTLIVLYVRPRAAILSGRYVSRTRTYDNASILPADVPTYAHHLRLAGYGTAASGKMHLVGADQFRGFEQRLFRCRRDRGGSSFPTSDFGAIISPIQVATVILGVKRVYRYYCGRLDSARGAEYHCLPKLQYPASACRCGGGSQSPRTAHGPRAEAGSVGISCDFFLGGVP